MTRQLRKYQATLVQYGFDFPDPATLPGIGLPTLFVPNLASLQAYPVTSFPDGQPARVYSLKKTQWFLNRNSTMAVDGITCIASSAGGSVRWERGITDHNGYHAVPRWHFADYGDDEADGETPGTAIKTFAEFERRVGPGYPTLTGELVTSPQDIESIALYVLTHMGEQDPLNIKATTRGGSILSVIGDPVITLATATVVSYSPPDPGAPGGGEMAMIDTGASLAAHKGKRCQITASANPASVGGVFFIEAPDLSGTAAGISPPSKIGLDDLPGSLIANGIQSPVTPQAGDTIVIQELPRVAWGNVDVRTHQGGGAVAFAGPKVATINLDFIPAGISDGVSPTTRNFMVPLVGGNAYFLAKGCAWSTRLYATAQNAGSADESRDGFLANCLLYNSIAQQQAGANYAGNAYFKGGKWTLQGGGSLAGLVVVDRAANVVVKSGWLSQESDPAAGINVLVKGSLSIYNAGFFGAVFDAIATSGDGDAPCGNIWLFNYDNQTNATVYGQRNGGAGFNIASGTTLAIGAGYVPVSAASLHLTGAAGDIILGGNATGRAWNEGAGSYDPAVVLTYANVVANGGLHNVQRDAHVVIADDTF